LLALCLSELARGISRVPLDYEASFAGRKRWQATALQNSPKKNGPPQALLTAGLLTTILTISVQ